jgi:hypothetical protein
MNTDGCVLKGYVTEPEHTSVRLGTEGKNMEGRERGERI